MTTLSSGPNIGSINLSTIPTTAEISETWTINETAIMYIRPKTVIFTAQGLKPNTKYYPFFDNVDISAFCSMEDGKTSSEIISNSIGSITGSFYIPSATFTCGSHTFKLVDAVKNTNSPDSRAIKLPDPQYGYTEAIYEASGLLKQQQKQITTLTVIDAPPPPQPPTQGVILPVIPKPLPPVLPPPPIIVYPPPVIPEPILPPFKINPPIPEPISPGKTGCIEWYYDYNVTDNAINENYTVPSRNPSPPTDLVKQLGSGIVNTDVLPKVTFIKSDKITDIHWNHTFKIEAPTTKKQRITVYTGAIVNERVPPTNTQFNVSTRPSGLPATAKYNPIIPNGSNTPWVYVGPTGTCAPIPVVIPAPWVEPEPVWIDPSTQAAPSPWSDPIAQSFIIEPGIYPVGVFATSITVYFKRVDQTCPVMLELRDMNNGFPGSNILPGGLVILPGSAVSQSDNATIPTTFSFDQPIYLAPSTPLCFVLKSSSLGYDIWCSRFGEIDVITGKVIDEQPITGVMFKSANNNTWTPTQYEDIKFDLNIAEFDNNLISKITLQPHKTTVGNINLYHNTKATLPLSYIYTTANSSIVKIYCPLHALLTGDKIYIGDFPDTYINGLDYTKLKNHAFTVSVIDEDYINITLDHNASKTGNILISDNPQIINSTPVDNIYKDTTSNAIPFMNANNNSLSVMPKIPIKLIPPTPPSSITASSFEIYINVIFNEVMIDYLGTELPNTSIDETITTVQGNASATYNGNFQYSDLLTTVVDNNNSYVEFETPRLFVSGHNEVMVNSTTNGLVSLELKSNDKHISPVIDLNGMSVIVNTYKIDNQGGEITAIFDPASGNTTSADFEAALNDKTQNSEIVAGKGNANAKYKSKIVNLNNAYTNKRISVFIVGNCPEPAAMDVYIRLSNDSYTHMDNDWKWMPLDNAKSDTLDYTKKFPNSINSSVMTEWYFEYDSAESFSVFDIKVVMRSPNNSIIPKLYGIRAITNES